MCRKSPLKNPLIFRKSFIGSILLLARYIEMFWGQTPFKIEFYPFLFYFLSRQAKILRARTSNYRNFVLSPGRTRWRAKNSGDIKTSACHAEGIISRARRDTFILGGKKWRETGKMRRSIARGFDG